MTRTAFKTITKPKFVVFYQSENFFVFSGVLMSDDDKFFIELDKLGDIFTEQRKRRIGNDNIGLR